MTWRGFLYRAAAFIILPALMLSSCLVTFLAVRYMPLRAEQDKEVALLKAEGGSLALSDLEPKPLPPGDKNAAALLIEAHVLRFEPAYEPGAYAPSGSDSTDAAESEDYVRKLNLADPRVPDDAKTAAILNAFNRWRGFRLCLSGNDLKTLETVEGLTFWNEAWLPLLESYLARNDKPLALVKEAAALDRGVFDVDWSGNRLAGHLDALASAAALLRTDAIVRARRGDAAGAVEDARLILRLRRFIDDEPMTASKVCAFNLDETAFSTLQGISQCATFERAGRAAVVKDLDGREQANSVTRALLGDTAVTRRGFASSLGPGAVARLSRYIWPVARYENDILTGMRLARAQSRLAFPQSVATIGAPRAQPVSPSAAMFYTMHAKQAIVPSARATALVGMARVWLALSLYKADTGQYPSKLDALVPNYLPAAQTDPFNGQPLRYVLTRKGCKVYSVGEDFVDDSGAQAQIGANSLPSGDIVWEMAK